jgi:hypothetical protein
MLQGEKKNNCSSLIKNSLLRIQVARVPLTQ